MYRSQWDEEADCLSPECINRYNMCTEYIFQREQFANYIYYQLKCLNHDVFWPIGLHMAVSSMLPKQTHVHMRSKVVKC